MSSTKTLNKGIIYMLIASFCFALTGACAKVLSDEVSPIQLVFFRNVIGIVYIIWVLSQRREAYEGGKFGLLVFRGVIGTIALYAFFYGIKHIGLAVAITYQQAYPIFIAFASFFLFGERYRWQEWVAIFIGFIGVASIFFPSINVGFELKTNIIGVSNALLTGMAYLSIRGLSKYYSTPIIVLSFMLAGIIVPMISMVLGANFDASYLDFAIAKWVNPTLPQLPWIMIMGVAALIGQIMLTKAFTYERTGVIAAVGYSNILFSVVFGMLLSDPWPGISGVLGICLVMLSGILIAVRPKRSIIYRKLN